MPRLALFLLVFSSGYLPLSFAYAAGCQFNGSAQNIFLSVPQMSIPADTPNGTVLYTSPKTSINLSCEGETYGQFVTAVTTSDFNSYLSRKNGITTTIYIDGKPYDRQQENVIGFTTATGNSFKKNLSVWVEIKVDSSKGKIPPEGTLLNGSFQLIYFLVNNNYFLQRSIISISTPDITFIPCTMEVAVSPNTIDFGAVKISDMEKGMKLQRKFTTLIQKSKGCTIAVSAPFGINMYFEPAAPGINADGSLNLNNGLGLSISDTSGKYIPFNTAWKIDDVKVDSILKNYFTANLQKISGQDVKTGPFSADVVVRLNFY